MTAESSSRLRMRIMPVVAATAALRGFRPVAKALGESFSMMYTLGIGRPLCLACSSTMKCSSGASCGVTSLAPAIFRASLSLYQYAPKFISSDSPKAIAIPPEPPRK